MKPQIMNSNFFSRVWTAVLVLLCLTLVDSNAQQRFGGGGGFGGFGGGGFGGFGANRFGGGSANTSGSGAYNNNGTVGNAVIQVDPNTHTLTVIADKETAAQIQRVIQSLDIPEPQVLIKVVFLEVQHNNASELGVQGTFTGGQNLSSITGLVTNYSLQNVVSSVVSGVGSNATTTTTTTPTLTQSVTPTYAKGVNVGNNFNLPSSVAGAAGNGGLYQILGNDFTATVQAVAAAGKSQVLSRPSILARDGQQAQIVVGQQIYLPSGVSYASVGTSGATVPTINGNYTDIGIILYVTPFVGDNGLVEMILQPQDTSIDTSSPGQVITYGSSLISSAPVYAPNLDVTEANTVVVTPNGQTVVIGGLMSNTKSTADTKVPFLGDIPILGQLFKSTSKAESKTELLMFLTPHIVEAPSQLMNMSSSEMHQTQLITNSVSEQELDRFLERVPVKKGK